MVVVGGVLWEKLRPVGLGLVSIGTVAGFGDVADRLARCSIIGARRKATVLATTRFGRPGCSFRRGSADDFA